MAPHHLRSDLVRLVDVREPRRWTIIDAISGRISRLSRRDWESLGRNRTDTEKTLLAQATAAGLLRKRVVLSRYWWTLPAQALAFRLPLVSIDPIAAFSARHSSFLFSPLAIIVWSVVAIVASLSMLFGWSRAEHSLAMIYGASGSATAIGYSMAAMFVMTKCLHELGHATACRRIGVPVGDVGLFFFCGVPCPYCDVSQVWRVDSRLQRAAVMMAGIYVELVLASVASLTWWLTSNGVVHLLAMNTIVVCGISTLVFNANPLMRLDGYYVLSDAIGTPNLRRQSALAWQGLIHCRLAGTDVGKASCSVTGCWLSIYHAASTGYRLMVSGVVLLVVLGMLIKWNLWWSGIAMVTSFVCMVTYRFARRWAAMTMGHGSWTESSLVRRLLYNAILFLMIAGLMSLPVRREVDATGFLDIADAVDVFVPEAAWVQRVDRDFGEHVAVGDSLATLRDDQLTIQLVSWKARQTMAALESQQLKRDALRNSADDVAWKLDKANREFVEMQYASLVDRHNRLSMTSPAQGVVLPPLDRHRARGQVATLHDRCGTFIEQRTPWCRIGDLTRTCAVLPVDAKQRQQLDVGDPVTVVIDDGKIRRVQVKVDAIEEISPSEQEPGSQSAFVVKCRLPAELFADEAYVPLGIAIHSCICTEREPVWRWLKRLTSEALRG